MVTECDSSSSRKCVDKVQLRVGTEGRWTVNTSKVGVGSDSIGCRQLSWKEGKESMSDSEGLSTKGLMKSFNGPKSEIVFEEVTRPLKKDMEVEETVIKQMSPLVKTQVFAKEKGNGLYQNNEEAGSKRRKWSRVKHKESLFQESPSTLGSHGSIPYIIELPEDGEESKIQSPMMIRQPVPQLAYERVLVQKFENVKLKRSLEEPEEAPIAKKQKVGGISEPFLLKDDTHVIFKRFWG